MKSYLKVLYRYLSDIVGATLTWGSLITITTTIAFLLIGLLCLVILLIIFMIFKYWPGIWFLWFCLSLSFITGLILLWWANHYIKRICLSRRRYDTTEEEIMSVV
jgi:hypothetical protein